MYTLCGDEKERSIFRDALLDAAAGILLPMNPR